MRRRGRRGNGRVTEIRKKGDRELEGVAEGDEVRKKKRKMDEDEKRKKREEGRKWMRKKKEKNLNDRERTERRERGREGGGDQIGEDDRLNEEKKIKRTKNNYRKRIRRGRGNDRDKEGKERKIKKMRQGQREREGNHHVATQLPPLFCLLENLINTSTSYTDDPSSSSPSGGGSVDKKPPILSPRI